MIKQHNALPSPLTGGSSLLAVFSVLCLTVFALLSISTVQADGRLGDAAARSVASYYQADAQAEAILARLRSGELPEDVSFDGEAYSYTCPISLTQVLTVQVAIRGADYTILRWQSASSTDWQPDEDIPVWDGFFPG